MNLGDLIKKYRNDHDLSQRQFAASCGLSNGYIAMIERGENPKTKEPIAPTLKALNKIADGLCMTTTELMEYVDNIPISMGEDDPVSHLANIIPLPKMVKKPRLGTIACGKPILAVEDAEEFDSVPVDADCDFTLKCKGDSMINARIFDGDIVYIRKQPEVELGQIAAVRIGDEATLKKVYYTPGSGRMILRACNPLYGDLTYEGEELNQVEIMGLAVGFFSLVRHEQ